MSLFGQVRVVVSPSDYDACMAFWRDVVGLAVVEAFADDAGVLLDLGPSVVLELVREGGADSLGVRLSAEVGDVDAWYVRLAEAGAAVSEPANQPWGHRSTTLRDPCGLLLTIFEVRT